MSVITFEKKFNQFISKNRSLNLSIENVFSYPSISELYQKVCKYRNMNSVEGSKAKTEFSCMLSDLKAVGFKVKEIALSDDPIELSINQWFLPLLKEFDKENSSKSWYLEESRNKYIDKFFFNAEKNDSGLYYKHVGLVLNDLLKDKKYAKTVTNESILKNLSVVATNFKNKTVFSYFPLALIANEIEDKKVQSLLKDNAWNFFPHKDEEMFKKISTARRQAAAWLRADAKAGTLGEKTQDWFNQIDISVPDDYQFYKEIAVSSRFREIYQIPEDFMVFVVNTEEASNYKLETSSDLNVSNQMGVFSGVSIALNKQYGTDVLNFLPSMGNYTKDDERNFKEDMLVDYLTGNDYYFTCISPSLNAKFKEPCLLDRMNEAAGYILENNLFKNLASSEKFDVAIKTFGFLEAKRSQFELTKVIESAIEGNLSDSSNEDVSKTFKL